MAIMRYNGMAVTNCLKAGGLPSGQKPLDKAVAFPYAKRTGAAEPKP